MATLDLERPRNLGEILSTCLWLYARFFLLFAALAVAVVLPIDLTLYGIGAGQLWSEYDDTWPLAVDIASWPIPILVMSPLISANHARAVVVLSEASVPPIGQTLVEAARLLPAVAWVVLLFTLGSFGGLLLFILPGVYLFVRWYVCAQVAVIERLRGRAALTRSGGLVEGSWWRVFGIVIVLFLIISMVGGGIYLPLDLLAEEADSGLVTLGGQILADTITYSFGALSATLLYFDLRYRHDRPELR